MYEQLWQEVVSCWAHGSEICFPFTPAPARACRPETNLWLRLGGVIVGVIVEYGKTFVGYVPSHKLFKKQPRILDFFFFPISRYAWYNGSNLRIKTSVIQLMLSTDVFAIYSCTHNKHA